MTKHMAAREGGNATTLPEAPADDRLLLALGRELDDLWEAVNSADLADDEHAENAALARINAVTEAIAAIPACTPDGAAVQLGVLYGMMTHQRSPYDPRILIIHSVLAVVEGLGHLGADHVGRRRYAGPNPFRAAQAPVAAGEKILA